MYHILYNLETFFDSLADVEKALENLVLTPRIPETAMELEDQETPRICVAPTIEDCITAIGTIGPFRRCANTNPDAKSYENTDEIYPIVVIELPDNLDYITPTKQQVPDVEETNEKWLTKPITPIKKSIKWLDQFSIEFDETHPIKTICTKVKFVENITGKHHPWLDRKGHPLNCSDYGSETWADNITKNIFHQQATQFLCWDSGSKQSFVYPMPISNNYVICHVMTQTETGFIPTNETYRTNINALRRFSGYKDKNGIMLFDGDLVWYGEKTPRQSGEITLSKNRWFINIWSDPGLLPISDIENETDILNDVQIMDTTGRD